VAFSAAGGLFLAFGRRRFGLWVGAFYIQGPAGEARTQNRPYLKCVAGGRGWLNEVSRGRTFVEIGGGEGWSIAAQAGVRRD